MTSSSDLGPASGMLARLRSSRWGKAAIQLLRWGLPAALLVIIGRRLAELGWREIWTARPANPGFYLLLVAQFFLQPFGDYLVYRNLWRDVPPMAIILRKRLMNTFMLDYSGEAFFYFWAQRNLTLPPGMLVHGIKDSNLLSGGAGLAMVWILGLILLVTGGLHIPVIPGQTWLYVLIGVVPFVLCGALFLVNRKVTVLSRRQLATVFAIHFLRASFVLLIEFGLWWLSGALTSAVACVQFVALRQVITRLPLVPNKDLIFVGVGIAAAGITRAAVTPVATVLLILAAADLVSGGHGGRRDLGAGPSRERCVMRAHVMSWSRSPLFWILLVAAALRLSGLFWGLPASDGWDDDGFAPRNFLTALALTWKHGAYFTYPPLHALLLAIPSLPVVAVALTHAPSLHPADVISTITQPVYMTYFTVVARLVNIAMSLGIIWCIGEMARLVAGRRAGFLAACACALNFGLTYYGQVSNLDVPYLFWALLALLAAMRAVALHEPRRIWSAALLAAAAVATKDQAYALFLLALPLFAALWFTADAWPRRNARAMIITLLPAALVAAVALLLVDGAITNMSGFARRLAFLAGPASGDYAEYTAGSAGWLALLVDMPGYYARGYGVVAMMLAALGLVLAARARGGRGAWVAGLLPALAIISFTVCFNFAALRSDDRFAMPQAVLATFYIGIAADALVFASQSWVRLTARAFLALTMLAALHQLVAIDAAFLFDPRYDAERWMDAHVKPGDSIETYGQNCFLPRFPAGARVSRMLETAPGRRNPLPSVVEIAPPFSGARQPRFILVPTAWASRYLRPDVPLGPGRIYSKIQQADFRNRDARDYFAALKAGKLAYRLTHVSQYSALWPAVHVHDSLDEPVWIFERLP